MKHSSVRTKIVLIAASFTLPLGVLLYLTVANINLRIDFARKEMAGTGYLRPLVHLLEGVQKYQMEQPGTGCARAAQQVDASLSSLEQADRSYGKILEFTPEGLGKRGRAHLTVDGLRKRWNAIAAGKCTARWEEFAAMNADIRGMITHAGDTSNLILDPDLDSYYLMDAVVVALPQTQVRLQAILNGRANRSKLGAQVAMLREADIERIAASLKTAFNEDANFYGASPGLRANLSPALEKYEAAAGRFSDLAGKEAEGETAPNLNAAGEQALAASFDLWGVSAGELDVLLEARIADSVNYRSWALGLAAMAIAAAYLLSWVFMRSITQPLDGLIRSLGPGASLLSECVNRISTVSGDSSNGESQIICEELNAHADDMRKAVYQLSIHVNGAGEAQPSTAGAQV